MQDLKRVTFAGHETFHCKGLWLKKGFDFVDDGKNFNDEDSVVYLGVGKNMVSSIRYWLRAFGIIDSETGSITDLGRYIFDDNGQDPFLEDVNTLWLLHFQLISVGYATLYRQLFLYYHKERKEFSKKNVIKFINRQHDANKIGGLQMPLNDISIEKDLSTLLRLYVNPNSKNYEDYSAILLDLDLITKLGKDSFKFNETSKAKIDPLIFLYAIKDFAGNEKIVPYEDLLDIALIFNLTQSEMLEMFEKLKMIDTNISFSNSAGEQLFTMNENLSKDDILNMYYKKQ